MPTSETPLKRSPRTANSGVSAWTDEAIETLKFLWAEGHSAAQIAGRIGVTRNAVIGKIHRLGLAARPPRPRASKPAAPRRAAVRRPVLRAAFIADPGDADISCGNEELTGEATLMSLGANMCRWPIGDPALAEFRLCGRAADGGPYCAHHARLAYVTPRVRSASNARLLSSLRRYV